MVTPRDLPGLEEDWEYLFEQLEEWIKGKKERYKVIAQIWDCTWWSVYYWLEVKSDENRHREFIRKRVEYNREYRSRPEVRKRYNEYMRKYMRGYLKRD